MTLRVLGAVMALSAMTTTLARADEIPQNVITAADEAGVDPLDLLGAVNTTHMQPEAYLCVADGLLCPKQAPAAVSTSPRIACIIAHESGGDPHARNARSGAAGLGQFLPSTWASTPQGKAGMSVYDSAANRAAIAYMLDAKRASEFDAVRFYGC